MTSVPVRIAILALLITAPAVWSMENENTALVKSLAMGAFSGAALLFLGPGGLCRALRRILPLPALFAFASVCAAFSPSPSFSLPAALGAATFLVLAAAAAHVPRGAWLTFISLSALIPLGAGLAQTLGIESAPWGQQVREHFHGRICSTLGNPNFYAAFLAGTAPFLAISAFRPGPAGWAASLLTGLAVVGLIGSGSKGGLLGFLAAAAVTWAVARRGRLAEILPPGAARSALTRSGLAALAGLLLALHLLPGAVRSRLLLASRAPEAASVSSDQAPDSSVLRDESVRFRLLTWTASLRALREAPLAGHGPGRFQVVYPRNRPPEIIRMFGQHSYMTDHPENISVEIAVDLGVAGLGLWIWFLLFLGRRILLSLRASPDPGSRRLAAACAGGLAGLLTANTFGLDIHYGATAALAACLTGCAAGNGIAAGAGVRPPRASPGGTRRFSAAGAAAGILVALAWMHIYASDAALARALSLSSAGAWDRAIALYGSAVRVNPANVMARYFGASALLDRGRAEDLTRARALLDSVRREAPDYVLLNHKYWLLYNRLGLKTEAARALKRQIELDPLAGVFFLERGRAAFDEGRREDARNDFEQAILIEPENPAGYQYLGNLLVTQRRFREALAVYATGLDRAPGNAELHYNAAVAAYRTGNAPLALRHARAALQANPGHPGASLIVRKLGP